MGLARTAGLDGADALMLSAVTSIGCYPEGAVTIMAKIIVAAERDGPGYPALPAGEPVTTGCAIARAAAEVAAVVGAKALVAFTMTGETARRLARHRSATPLLAFTPKPATRSQLALTWGAETFVVPEVAHTDDMVRQVEAALLDIGRCGQGDLVVLVAGSPPGTPAGPTSCACTASAARSRPDLVRTAGSGCRCTWFRIAEAADSQFPDHLRTPGRGESGARAPRVESRPTRS